MDRSGEGEMPEAGNESGSGNKVAGQKPDFRVVQPEYDSRVGKSVFKDVGAIWRNTSKSGNEFYTMKIGKLKLLVFRNDKE